MDETRTKVNDLLAKIVSDCTLVGLAEEQKRNLGTADAKAIFDLLERRLTQTFMDVSDELCNMIDNKE